MVENHSKILIMQHNTARNPNVMYSCLEIAKESATDFVLMQEPWIEIDNNAVYTISHPSYHCILPTIVSNIRPRVSIYARKQSKFSFCQRTDLTLDSDILIIDISGPKMEPFHLINIYNEKSLDPDLNSTNYIVERSLQ